MSWTNATLTTAIQDYLDSSESSLVTNIPNFIKATEEKILKSVQLDLFRKNVTGNATASNTYLTMPTDFLSPFSLALIALVDNHVVSVPDVAVKDVGL